MPGSGNCSLALSRKNATGSLEAHLGLTLIAGSKIKNPMQHQQKPRLLQAIMGKLLMQQQMEKKGIANQNHLNKRIEKFYPSLHLDLLLRRKKGEVMGELELIDIPEQKRSIALIRRYGQEIVAQENAASVIFTIRKILNHSLEWKVLQL